MSRVANTRQMALLSLGLLIHLVCAGQDPVPDNYIWEWRPNPTDFILKNGHMYFSEEELRLIVDAKSVVFNVDIDILDERILAVTYSDSLSSMASKIHESATLPNALSLKLAKVLYQKIGISDITTTGLEVHSKEARRFLLVLSFDDKDKKKVIRPKSY